MAKKLRITNFIAAHNNNEHHKNINDFQYKSSLPTRKTQYFEKYSLRPITTRIWSN